MADELIKGQLVTKFPGGGLELGEGLIDGLKREFLEEVNVVVEVEEHFYTTDFFVASAFDADSQVISIYFHVSCKDCASIKASDTKFDFEVVEGKDAESFRWVNVADLAQETDVVLPIDKVVVSKLIEQLTKV
jgi:ADP-ribose pyrophosphatase YjhB (NUDIX family)